MDFERWRRCHQATTEGKDPQVEEQHEQKQESKEQYSELWEIPFDWGSSREGFCMAKEMSVETSLQRIFIIEILSSDG